MIQYKKIALEKGGIIKKDRPVLVGPEAPHDVLRQCANEKGASAYYTCDDVLGDFVVGSIDNLLSSKKEQRKIKDYDIENSNIVKAAFRIMEEYKNREMNHDSSTGAPSWKHFRTITDEHIQLGTAVRPPCRFEIVHVPVDKSATVLLQSSDSVENDVNITNNTTTVTTVLDVAHNPPAIIHLVSKLQQTFPDTPKRFVAGFSSDKDLRLCTKSLIEASDGDINRIHLVQASHPRAATLEAILEASPQLKNSASACHLDSEDRSITGQLQLAIQIAMEQKEILVVCGSVFIMAEAREALGFDEPRDSEYISEVAGANLRHGQENFGDTKMSDNN